jgi:transcriptional regulator with XRE-family HTH domain
MSKRQTLRQVAARAAVALGYLSEIERGQKEVSSELLFSIAEALDVPISQIMREVSVRLAVAEGVQIPDTVPAEFVASFDSSLLNA